MSLEERKLRVMDAVYVYKLIGGNKLALHGRYHAHKEGYEFHLFLEGSGSLLLNHSRYRIEGNRLFLAAPGEFHSILPEAITNHVSYYAILFEPELPADFEITRLLRNHGGRHLATEPRERFWVGELFRLHEKGNAKAAGHLLSSLLYRWYGEPQPEKPEKNEHINRALVLMEKSVKEKLSTELMAEKLGISKEHFIRVFRGKTGVSPLQYFTRLKIDAAGAFLTDSNLRVGAVAEYFGFESPFHFSNVFKKHTGLAPKDYRKTFRRV